MDNKIHLSVVSHGHGETIGLLLDDLKEHADTSNLRVTLTLNIPEQLPFDPAGFPFPVQVFTNSMPKGFGANHNTAFNKFQRDAEFYCVINPDIRIHADVFETLMQCLSQERIGVAAPLVQNSQGLVEDNARALPTPWTILKKACGVDVPPMLAPGGNCREVDWVAGMFMLFPKEVYARLGGFDNRYFLYYEDVDICCRLYLAGYTVAVVPAAVVEHDAQRDSHRKLGYFRWHLASISRFFLSRAFIRRWWQIRRV